MNRIKGLLLLVGLGLLVFFITREAYRPEAATEQVSSTVLLERIRPVLKLVTVEGDFSELYTYRNAEAPMDWMKSFSPFQKKAILRVKGRCQRGLRPRRHEAGIRRGPEGGPHDRDRATAAARVGTRCGLL